MEQTNKDQIMVALYQIEEESQNIRALKDVVCKLVKKQDDELYRKLQDLADLEISSNELYRELQEDGYLWDNEVVEEYSVITTYSFDTECECVLCKTLEEAKVKLVESVQKELNIQVNENGRMLGKRANRFISEDGTYGKLITYVNEDEAIMEWRIAPVKKQENSFKFPTFLNQYKEKIDENHLCTKSNITISKDSIEGIPLINIDVVYSEEVPWDDVQCVLSMPECNVEYAKWVAEQLSKEYSIPINNALVA